MGIELELGASQKLTEFSSAGCSVVAGLQVPILPLPLNFLPQPHHSQRRPPCSIQFVFICGTEHSCLVLQGPGC